MVSKFDTLRSAGHRGGMFDAERKLAERIERISAAVTERLSGGTFTCRGGEVVSLCGPRVTEVDLVMAHNSEEGGAA